MREAKFGERLCSIGETTNNQTSGGRILSSRASSDFLNPSQSCIYCHQNLPYENLKRLKLSYHPLSLLPMIGYLQLLLIPALIILDNSSPSSYPDPSPISGLLRPLTVWEWPPCLLPTCYNKKLGAEKKEKGQICCTCLKPTNGQRQSSNFLVLLNH